MSIELHFLRPWWLLTSLPLLGLWIYLWKQKPRLHGWAEVCDPHLLAHLIQKKGQVKRLHSLVYLLLSGLFMILSLAGPTWYKLPVSTYKPLQPRVVVLDMSENMKNQDLSPNRLSRAKFKLRDLFAHKEIGQFGLIAFTGEPFIVSPLTDDGQTISSLLSSLRPEIMPVNGHNLPSALEEASQLIKQAGYTQGQVLVLTGEAPTAEAITLAKKLASTGVVSSIMPIRGDREVPALYQRFAEAGQGKLIPYTANSKDLDEWIAASANNQFVLSQEDIPLWQDEGPWFLIPALLLFSPVFRRDWLQRVFT